MNTMVSLRVKLNSVVFIWRETIYEFKFQITKVAVPVPLPVLAAALGPEIVTLSWNYATFIYFFLLSEKFTNRNNANALISKGSQSLDCLFFLGVGSVEMQRSTWGY